MSTPFSPSPPPHFGTKYSFVTSTKKLSPCKQVIDVAPKTTPWKGVNRYTAGVCDARLMLARWQEDHAVELFAVSRFSVRWNRQRELTWTKWKSTEPCQRSSAVDTSGHELLNQPELQISGKNSQQRQRDARKNEMILSLQQIPRAAQSFVGGVMGKTKPCMPLDTRYVMLDITAVSLLDTTNSMMCALVKAVHGTARESWEQNLQNFVENQQKPMKDSEISFVSNFSHLGERNFAAPLFRCLRRRNFRSKYRTMFHCRAIFRKKFRWVLRNCSAKFPRNFVALLNFGRPLRNFEFAVSFPLWGF